MAVPAKPNPAHAARRGRGVPTLAPGRERARDDYDEYAAEQQPLAQPGKIGDRLVFRRQAQQGQSEEQRSDRDLVRRAQRESEHDGSDRGRHAQAAGDRGLHHEQRQRVQRDERRATKPTASSARPPM